MKVFYSSAALCLLALQLHSQDFNGYRSGNYTGVNGVFFNPSSIADSRYRFDVNLFSIGSSAGNNQAYYNLNNTVSSFDADSLKSQLFGKDAGLANGALNVDLRGLSLMFSAGRLGFAFTSRGRVMSNVHDIDGRLINQVIDDFEDQSQLPYTISSGSNMRMNVHSWTEYGFTMAGVLGEDGPHFVKGGVTFKYLAGVGNAYLNIVNLNTTLNEDAANDVYVNNTTGRLAMGFGGMSLSDFDLAKFTYFKSTGLGGDLGLTYEYRPDYDGSSASRKDLNKYKVKLGVSLLDIGKIRYEKDPRRSGGYKIDITGSEKFYLNELNNISLDDYSDFFQSKPQYFAEDSSNAATYYQASLPTTLNLDLDYHFARGFYINFATQLPLTSSETEVYNSHSYKAITVTPRFEGRAMGLYIPINYNELTQFNAGVGVRMGPFFAGSGSVLTALFDNSKQADFYFGMRLGGLYKNDSKKQGKKDKKLQEEYRNAQGRSL